MAEIVADRKDRKTQEIPHNVIIENRGKINISGVNDVDSFDESSIVIYTSMGGLTLKGSNLHISRLDVGIGEMSVEGEIISLTYSSAGKRPTNLLSRLFK